MEAAQGVVSTTTCGSEWTSGSRGGEHNYVWRQVDEWKQLSGW